jgi:hypothetical protein
MKKISLLVLICLAALISCKKEENFSGKVCASVENPATLLTNETVSFINCSENANHYLWEFGDGSVSTDESPNHVYTEAGTYTIVLVIQEKELTDINGDDFVDSKDRIISSSDISSFEITVNKKNIFPKVLTRNSISHTDVLFYINGLVKNLADYDIEELWQNPYFPYNAFWNSDSVEFINDLNFNIYYLNGNVLQAEYEIRNDSLFFSRIYYEDAWISVAEDVMTITGNFDQLTFAKTAFKYCGYSYDENEKKVDVNADNLIDENDKIVSAEIYNAHYSLAEINELWKATNFDYMKADTILVLQYDLSFSGK